MLGNILYGGYIYGDKKLGIFVAESGPDLSKSLKRQLTRGRIVFSSLPAKPRDYALDFEISFQDNNQSVPRGVTGVYGTFEEFGTVLHGGSGSTGYTHFIAPEIIATGYGPVYLTGYADFDIAFIDDNTIMWSDIGSLTFDITQSNVAGKMPLEWRGYIYQVSKLGKYIYVYGENGITKLIPSGIYFGQQTLLNIGIKNKTAFCSTIHEHYFILSNNYFCRLNSVDGLVKIGYQEFMEELVNPVISFDEYNNNLYICDGTNGYIYSITDKSLGKGESSVTGVLYQDNALNLFSSLTTTSLGQFNLCTDIYDLGTRKEKTIFNLEIASDCNELIEAAIDFRFKKEEAFVTIPYKKVNPNGEVDIPCVGVDFRFKFRANLGSVGNLRTFKIDYIKINGVIHGFSFLDTITMK